MMLGNECPRLAADAKIIAWPAAANACSNMHLCTYGDMHSHWLRDCDYILEHCAINGMQVLTSSENSSCI